MTKAVVFGNGESRKWADNVLTFDRHDKDVVTWGCNAIYRDMWVDNLVAVDYPMQQDEVSFYKLESCPCRDRRYDVHGI